MKFKVFLLIILFVLPASAQVTQVVRNTPTVIKQPKKVASGSQVRSLAVTSDCLGAAGVDARATSIGLSFFRSTKIKQCDCRENAKVYEWLNEHDKAVTAMDECRTPPTERCFLFFKCKIKVTQ